MLHLCAVCVCVNTMFLHWRVTVVVRDGHPKESDRPAGEKTARKKGLVAGSPGHEIATARLEHKPRLAGKFGIATAQSARL